MRNRWQLFTSNLIVFSAWYILFYFLSAGGGQGALSALMWALGTLVVGGVLGVIVGATAHALELRANHRDVRAGDARDGARITLGKLPKPVAVQPNSPTPPVAKTPEPEPASVSEPAPIAAREPIAVESHAPASPTPVSPSRLAVEGAAFARAHAGVRVSADGAGRAFGSIDRATDPADFAAFLELIGRLSAEGIDVSAVLCSCAAGGVPAVVTFPVFIDGKEVR